MNCQTCGEVCNCPMEPPPNTFSPADTRSQVLPGAGDGIQPELPSGETEAPAWRDELSARLSRYRTRRKAPPPRYPSLRLPFDAAASSNRLADASPMPVFETTSNHALALDGMSGQSTPIAELAAPSTPELPPLVAEPKIPRPRSQPSAKIIEFPRFAWGPPSPPPDQLAEPVGEQLRILEVPEVAPPLPALGGITIEPAEVAEAEKRPGVDIPLLKAPLTSRLFAWMLDGIILSAASAFFGFIFWKVAAVRPPRLQLLGLLAGFPCLFWIAYQYLLMVYGGTTPGLRMARLELTRFDGSPVSRSLRRWRVLASCLSAVSLGMGYVWLLLDEDALCWHDRITRTYLAPGNVNREKVKL
jgi:uncharacterized RDD family membrane protein YckC